MDVQNAHPVTDVPVQVRQGAHVPTIVDADLQPQCSQNNPVAEDVRRLCNNPASCVQVRRG